MNSIVVMLLWLGTGICVGYYFGYNHGYSAGPKESLKRKGKD